MMVATVALAALVAVGSIGWLVRDQSARQAKLNDGVELARARCKHGARPGVDLDGQPARVACLAGRGVGRLQTAEELAGQDRAAVHPVLRQRLQALRALGRRRNRLPVCRLLRRRSRARDRVGRAQESVQERGSVSHASRTVSSPTMAWTSGQRLSQRSAVSCKKRPRPIQAICWSLFMFV